MDIGSVQLVDIEREVREAYLDYAMSVITSRALPDVRDGLKPVQRRILYTMYDNGLRPDRPYKKSAATVGDVLGKYHPHGDGAVYDAMVRLAQPFSMRYPLVDGQGNFGSIDGDPAAAHRYTEARPAALAMEMLADIDMETVDTRPNYDDSRTEPAVLPARIPNLLVNGATGIAVGMATNIPPHNLVEVCDALVHVIDHIDDVEHITPESLLQFIHGPDFPTGAMIMGREGILNAYATGRGRVLVRARAHFEEVRPGREAIVVTEIPFQVNKSTLIERIADLVRAKRIDTISDLRDETDRHGIRVVIELKRGADAGVTLNQLYKYSQLQATFGINMLALVDGEPRVLPLKRMLLLYLDHRRDVTARRTEYELARARHRQHVLEGLRIALANLDAVIDTIRRSPDAAGARDNLMARFGLSEIQAQAILDMQLRRLAALEREKIEEEYRTITARIGYLESLLADPKLMLGVIRDDIVDIRARYGDARRTTIEAAPGDLGIEDLIVEENVLITVTQRGYVKRVPVGTYRAQQRGGRGIIGARARADDVVRDTFVANTRDTLLLFTDRGRVFRLPAWQVPESGREAAGTPLANLVQLDAGERSTAIITVPADRFDTGRYLVMATVNGRVKRTALSEYANVRPSGLIAINLDPGDALGWAKVTSGDDEIIVVTRRGMALRFHEDDARPMGRAAGGVNAIRLKRGDRVAAVDVVDPDGDLFVITRRGYGKRTPMAEYNRRGRYTQGVMTIDARRLRELGEIVDARVVHDGQDIALITDQGIVMRTETDMISRMGRLTRGVIVMRPGEGDAVVSLAHLEREAVEGDEAEDGDDAVEAGFVASEVAEEVGPEVAEVGRDESSGAGDAGPDGAASMPEPGDDGAAG